MSLAAAGPAPERNATIVGLIVCIGLLAAWQLSVQFAYSGNGTIPTPAQILGQFRSDGLGFYIRGGLPTLKSAAIGWLWGNGLAVVCAVVALLAPPLARPILQLGVVSVCLPIVAVGPILTILFAGDTPRIVLAALAVFFTTLVGAVLGLRSADPVALDLVRAFGGRRRHEVMKVRLRAALPSLLAALRIASPSAVLGAMVAEFLGAENGLGVLLINSQQALNYSRTWAIAIFATAIAGLAYAVMGLLARLLTPWARETSVNLAAMVDPGATPGRGAHRVLSAVLSTLVAFALIFAVWEGLLIAFGVSPFIGKGPLDVLAWLTNPEAGADNRAALLSEAMISLRDASLGLFAGSAAALLTAIAFAVWPALHRALIGPSLALQSVPLIAVTPVIVLIFGRSFLAIAVIAGMVAFFPTLVNVSLALARTPRQMMDVMHVYGASRLSGMLKAQLPAALPALFASLRVAAPLAVTGALLAEWLATGEGLGYAMLSASAQSDYEGLWARVAVTTLFTLIAYKVVGWVEQAVVAALSGGAARGR